MSIAEKLTTIAENQQKVYEAGQKSEYDRFWDEFQENGNRNHYFYAFSYHNFDDTTYNPKYPIKTGISNTGGQNLFYSSYGITDTKVDISFERTANGAFNSAKKMKTIRKIIATEDVSFTNTFSAAESLENVTIEGTIGVNGFNVQWSPLLTHDSLMSIINALKDYSEDTSGTTWLITLGSDNIAKLSNDELNMIEAKGWQYG